MASLSGEPAGSPQRWRRHANRDGSLGGLVRDDAAVHPDAFLGSEAVVYGPGVRLGAGTRVTGLSTVGGKVETAGRVEIEESTVFGGLRRTSHLADSTVRHARIHASDAISSTIEDGASIVYSKVTDSRVAGRGSEVNASVVDGGAAVLDGAKVFKSGLKEGAQARGAGVELLDVFAGNGAVLERPGRIVAQEVNDQRHAFSAGERRIDGSGMARLDLPLWRPEGLLRQHVQ
ncbi:MAG: hypothetical protein PW734_12265 [Verrucomicrobium sp.]|nr:hypothetical protein [Verrucomicrobium sp.]